MSSAPTHLDLVAAAHRLRRAGLARDRQAVHTGLAALRHDLAVHLAAEHGQFDVLSPAARATVQRAQQRLRAQLDELLGDIDDDHDCRCAEAAIRLEGALATEARLEARLVEDHQRRRALRR